MRELPSRFALRVGVPVEPRDIIRDEHVRFLSRDSSGVGDFAAESRQQIRSAELYVVEHLGDGVSVDEVGDLVALGLGQTDVNRVRIAEEVVEIAKDLLI